MDLICHGGGEKHLSQFRGITQEAGPAHLGGEEDARTGGG